MSILNAVLKIKKMRKGSTSVWGRKIRNTIIFFIGWSNLFEYIYVSNKKEKSWFIMKKKAHDGFPIIHGIIELYKILWIFEKKFYEFWGSIQKYFFYIEVKGKNCMQNLTKLFCEI